MKSRKSHSPRNTFDCRQDPIRYARSAGLRYVQAGGPGITRKVRRGKFVYIDLDGSPIRDPAVVRRINSLVIPPAYRDVWICPYENGHLQATGIDAKGRKQYRYHPRWRVVRDESKYGSMIAFADALPLIRRRVEHDLAKPELPREKVLAALVRLLETTMIRVGNVEYVKANHSYGLTTLRSRHVNVEGSTVHFHFRGKSGKVHSIDLKNRRLAGIVRRCQDLPGQDLFEYRDEQGLYHAVTSTDVNAYLREVAGEEFSAKDFRTWAGTVLAAAALREYDSFESEAEAKRYVVRVIECVAERLGNTPAICRKCYVHPEVIAAYLDGTLGVVDTSLHKSFDSQGELKAEESAVVLLLRKRRQAGSTTRDSHN